MKKLLLTLVLASSLSLGACAQPGQQNAWNMGNKQTVGAATGAVLGGLAGSQMGKGHGQLWATGAGALLGAFAGGAIGAQLDANDRMMHEQAVGRAYSAPLNDTISWNNPENGHRGSVTPIQEGRHASSGNLCRRYKQTIVIDGKAETAYGQACKNNDGTWTLAN